MFAQRPRGRGAGRSRRRRRRCRSPTARSTPRSRSSPCTTGAIRSAGSRELARVARRQVFLSFDAVLDNEFWLVDDYFPEIRGARHERRRATRPTASPKCSTCSAVEPVPVPADCVDGFAACFWNRPEAYIDPVRAGGHLVSGACSTPTCGPAAPSACAPTSRRARGTRATATSGRCTSIDVGYRLIVAGA